MFKEHVPPIENEDARRERANDLLAAGLNGLEMVLVTLGPPAGSGEARLDLYFVNDLQVAAILAEIVATPARAGEVFRVHGGLRVPAGPGSGEVRCTAVTAGPSTNGLTLTVTPIGDYSTYRLEILFDPARIDPFFSELPFKFRPGCFTNDCSPASRHPAAIAAPAIDYLAKDYDSFRHTLTAAMMERVPGWQITSEADLDQVLIDLFAAVGDELSDYQDRVMNEAYLARARKRVSIARHARLVDYHIHQGNQASTWLGVLLDDLVAPFTLGEDLVAWAGHPDAEQDWIHFATREAVLDVDERTVLDPLFNSFRLHTWSGARPALPAGATSADLVPEFPAAGQVEAENLRDHINDGTLPRLLLEEKLNPLTGRAAGSDPRKRQILNLERRAEAVHDPLTDTWLVRVPWREEDRLAFDYSFTTSCPDGAVDRVSLFYGNLVLATQGRPVVTHFYEPGTALLVDTDTVKHRHFDRWELYDEPRGVLCALPHTPLAHRPTPPGGEVAPRSTLDVEVEIPGGGSERWDEVISLVKSDDSAEEGDHFVVETDENRQSVVRFGNGVNGRLIPEGAIVHCRYQHGGGIAGNVGAGTLQYFEPLSGALSTAVVGVWNPFDVTDGREREPVETILRAAPEAYRSRQLRAITLADYVRRAHEVPGVSRAVARYAWTGSWRTVRIVIDPRGTTTLSPDLRKQVTSHLEAVRLIGEDLEIRPPRFVPLDIVVSLCLHTDVWPEDLRYVLEREFSDGHTADGRPGFFHPDLWTFGQPLHRSEIAGRLHAIPGVEHVVDVDMRRFDAPTPGLPSPDVLVAAFDEIFLVRNDPDHRERGSIEFGIDGGRR